jgi:hypothetical protein
MSAAIQLRVERPCPEKRPWTITFSLSARDHPVFVSQRWRRAFDQIEEALSPWRDVGTVLDIVWRPKTFSGLVIALVEKCLESFEDKCLVRFLDCLRHFRCSWFEIMLEYAMKGRRFSGQGVLAGSNRDDDLSELPARFQISVCLDNLVE